MSFVKTISIPENKDEMVRLKLKGIDLAEYYLFIAKRIKDELVVLSQLEGRNLATCLDYRFVQHEDGIGWDIHMNMESLTPLYEYMLINNLTEQDVAYLGSDISLALEACHSAGVFHGDVTMGNIYVTEEKRFMLDYLGDRRLRRIMYGENQNPDGASDDIQSLGLLMYSLLNDLKMPFEDDGLDDLSGSGKARLLSGEKIPFPSHGSESLISVICKACSADSDTRYDSMNAFGSAIDGTVRNTDRVSLVISAGGAVDAGDKEADSEATYSAEAEVEEIEQPEDGDDDSANEDITSSDTILAYINQQDNHRRDPIEYMSYTRAYNWNDPDAEESTIQVGSIKSEQMADIADCEPPEAYYEAAEEIEAAEELEDAKAYEDDEIPEDDSYLAGEELKTEPEEPGIYAQKNLQDEPDYNEKPARRKLNRKHAVILAAAVAVIIVAGVALLYALFFAKDEVDLAQTMGEVTVEGFDGKAKVQPISLDEEKLDDLIIGLEIRDEERIAAVKEFYSSVRYLPSPAKNVSNGDKITIKAKYDGDLAKKARLEIVNDQATYTVSDLLKEPLITDRTWFKNVSQNAEGIEVEEICLGPVDSEGKIYVRTAYQSKKTVENIMRNAIIKKYSVDREAGEPLITDASRKDELEAMVKSATDAKLAKCKSISYKGEKYYRYYGTPVELKGTVKELDDEHIVYERSEQASKPGLTIKYSIEDDISGINVEDVKGYDISKGSYDKK